MTISFALNLCEPHARQGQVVIRHCSTSDTAMRGDGVENVRVGFRYQGVMSCSWVWIWAACFNLVSQVNRSNFG
jgi:hypothetical protein